MCSGVRGSREEKRGGRPWRWHSKAGGGGARVWGGPRVLWVWGACESARGGAGCGVRCYHPVGDPASLRLGQGSRVRLPRLPAAAVSGKALRERSIS
ncbi:unnamed protein product [Ectocarpus sp. CCAP 1310/34]|nr:unnamed protein product [Ectocarpus sp. CCAP 1310/34]